MLGTEYVGQYQEWAARDTTQKGRLSPERTAPAYARAPHRSRAPGAGPIAHSAVGPAPNPCAEISLAAPRPAGQPSPALLQPVLAPAG